MCTISTMISKKGISKPKKCSSTEESIESNIAVKLRRLKIDENLLLKGIGKTSDDFEDESEIDEYCYLDSKSLFNKLKVSYIDIRDLFEELKVNTSTENNLQTLDIDEFKKNVINLEDKIEKFRTFLNTKMKNLKSEEQELSKQIEEIPDELFVMKERQKMHIKPFTDIVSSPVKLLINSPLKCQEVQEFQDFLINSKNQYGGWIHYNHIIFENCWQKYFSLEKNTDDIQNSRYFQVFIQDVHRKFPDLSFEEIKLHIDWYMKYLHFKERQQKALDKWKKKKELLKSPLKQQDLQSTNENISSKLCRKTSMEETCSVDSKSFSKDYVNDLVSDELKKINGQLSDELKRCISMEQENAEFEQLINETIDLDTSGLGSLQTFSEKKVVQTTVRPLLAYRNATEQWHHRCNAANDSSPIYMNVESLTKRRIPEWRLGLHSEE